MMSRYRFCAVRTFCAKPYGSMVLWFGFASKPLRRSGLWVKRQAFGSGMVSDVDNDLHCRALRTAFVGWSDGPDQASEIRGAGIPGCAGALLLLAEVCLRALFLEGRKLANGWVVHSMVAVCVLLFCKTFVPKRDTKLNS